MAEILVEPNNNNRRRSPIWPWILGAILLLGLIWFAVDRDDDPQPVATNTTAPIPQDRDLDENLDNNVYDRTSAEGVAGGPVAAFINFTEEENRPENDQQHAYTSDGINKLSAALVALADRDGGADANINQRKETFQQNASQLQRNPQSLQHANTVKSTFMEASDLLAAIKEKSYPDSDADIDEVREAATKLDENKPLTDQQDEVDNFFDEIGEAIEELDGGNNRTDTRPITNDEINR
ncbi:MAG: hypothetical protein KY428_12675 [Bacteroidetes bacterium]|nr:hypothetical protein [Bacteroidota bacterium]